MPDFEKYFTDTAIVRCLSRIRANGAKSRHDDHFLRNLSRQAELADRKAEVDALLPPRRQWKRPSKNARSRQTTADINARAAFHAAMADLRSTKSINNDRTLALRRFVADVRWSALRSAGHAFGEPTIFPIEKGGSGNYYRPLALYSLADRVVGSLVGRYLREKFDEELVSQCYAFRVGRHGTPPLTHHDAVAKLMEYRDERKTRPLWVAECDIQAFFDCVHHDAAMGAIDEFCTRVGGVDGRALTALRSYLSSYSFARSVAASEKALLADRGDDAQFKWPRERLRAMYGAEFEAEPIGIPQGGSLSCLLANVVLDSVDRKVLKAAPDAFYGRYCDDMLVVSESRDECQSAFDAYCRGLDELRLPHHRAEAAPYGKRWWKLKSKDVYEWAQRPGVPWVGFVGYQVRWDGLMRVRPSSLEKELLKQVREADNVLRVVRDSGRPSPDVTKSRHQIVHRLEQRLVAMSVGRSPGSGTAEACWCAGFRLLDGESFVRRQLRALDRNRERQLRRVRRAVAAIEKETTSSAGRVRGPRRRGRTTSYDGQF